MVFLNSVRKYVHNYAFARQKCSHTLSQSIDLSLSLSLIQNGGDVNILDADKHTPIYYARQNGHQDAVQILIANSCVDDSSDNGSIDAAQQSVM